MAGKPLKTRGAEIKQIARLLFENKSDSEIIRTLNLPTRTYYKYKHHIYQDFANDFKEEQMSNVGYYSAKLHYKLSQYQAMLESSLDSCTEAKDRIATVDLAADLAKTIFELEMHRLQILNDIKSLDNKVLPYIHQQDNNNKNDTTSIPKEIRFVPANSDES
jgi:ACT domain-containing protein